MIIITGAAGFIGSCLAGYLNQQGLENLVLVDDHSKEEKNRNLEGKRFLVKMDRHLFPNALTAHAGQISLVLHIGARTDTTEFNVDLLKQLNTEYSKHVWNFCTEHQIPLIYASSAATYGDGSLGYSDASVHGLQPLNPYGWSKQWFDEWVLEQKETPPFWAGLKFFNVYGPNEYHKARMASVIFHAFNQIRENGRVRLFRSHRPDFEDGYQLRDFIYVKDVLRIIYWMMEARPESGLYNLGTGKARAFKDLAAATASALERPLEIDWVDIPEDIRDKYQYYTQADMSKLLAAGYDGGFTSLETGITEYVRNYLLDNRCY
jgi:ADP-L-glycero-D-manno-heptose 6-epimerase